MKSRQQAGAALLALSMALSPAPGQFQAALPGYHYQFPHDYFNHPAYQTEWWYYTGNLETAGGRKFGFELTFFRQGTNRDPLQKSAWDIRDLYGAHFALSDLDEKRFFHDQRVNRAGPGLAGASEALKTVWNGNWKVVWSEDGERLTANAGSLALDLTLKSLKPPVIHGENGVSQKSAGRGRASHYFSETRLAARGCITAGARSYPVTGWAWMDHEFFTHQLEPDQAGWDWLCLQLDDRTELMLFHIRRRDGSIDPFSAGTFVDARGRSTHLHAQDFELEPAGDRWTSPQSGARYPIRWTVRVAALGLSLEVSTRLPAQELASRSNFFPSYWEGAILLGGKKGAAELRGVGYLEMTGYDRPVNW
jgi:predicted secreted hydrolase